MGIDNNKCAVCGDEFIHPDIHWDFEGAKTCSPTCVTRLIAERENVSLPIAAEPVRRLSRETNK